MDYEQAFEKFIINSNFKSNGNNSKYITNAILVSFKHNILHVEEIHIDEQERIFKGELEAYLECPELFKDIAENIKEYKVIKLK